MVKNFIVGVALALFASCYEVKEHQCEAGAVRCDDGEALTCAENDSWFYWNRERCFNTICVLDTSGEDPFVMCAIDDKKDERCATQEDNTWICVSETEVVRCNNGYATREARCPVSSTCSADTDQQRICTTPTEAAPYCQVGVIGAVCADDDATAYCDLDGFTTILTPCRDNQMCIDGQCQ